MKCLYGDEVEEIKTILSYVGEVEGPYDDLPENEQYVICTGFIERAIPCGHSLGEGYGDVDFFSTKELAEIRYRELKEKEGKLL